MQSLSRLLDRLETATGGRADVETYRSLLRACRRLSDGKRIHAYMAAWLGQRDEDAYNVGSLVDMYGRCGSPGDAERVLVEHAECRSSVVLWTSLVSGHSEQGDTAGAVRAYGSMLLEGISPDYVTFIAALGACGGPAALATGRMLHHHALQSGAVADVRLGNALVAMYGRCAAVEEAQLAFTCMAERNVVSWTAMVTAFAYNGQLGDALACFRSMLQQGAADPNSVTFAVVLGACWQRCEGEWVYALAGEAGYRAHPAVCNAAMVMYGRLGCVEEARRTFERHGGDEIVSWNTMAAVYAGQQRHAEALCLFRQQLQLSSGLVDKVSCLQALALCSSMHDGRPVHDVVRAIGAQDDEAVANALRCMYARCGGGDHQDEVPPAAAPAARGIAQWNAMMGAHAERRQWRECGRLFRQLQLQGVRADRATLTALLDACGGTAALSQGRHAHALAAQSGWQSDTVVGTALVNMYARCGCPEEAAAAFAGTASTNELSWNSLFGAYARRGQTAQALKLFERMQQEGVKMQPVSLLCLLSACSHAGLLHECCRHFGSMQHDYGVQPSAEHTGCVVDLLARLGLLPQAQRLASTPAQWMSLLAACRTHNHVSGAQLAATRLMQLDPKRSASYVVLSNMYTNNMLAKSVLM